MKRILRIFLINILAVYLATQIASGMVFSDYTQGVLVTGFALGLASFTIKPIIKILIMPLSLATLGFFRFMAGVITLYVVDLAVDQFHVEAFSFHGLKTPYFNLPSFSYTGLGAYIAFALVISFIVSLINWLRK